MSGLNWNQTVGHSGGIHNDILKKNQNTDDENIQNFPACAF